jgi:predicted phage gp36 major capsid-like protein
MSFKKCPFCMCLFANKADLEVHLEVFGREKSQHREQLRIVHEEAEETLERAHGGADRVVFELVREVLREKRRRIEFMARKVLGEEGYQFGG